MCVIIRKTPCDDTTFVFIREETGFVIKKKRKYFVIITKDLVTVRKPGDSSLSSQTQYTPRVQGCVFCFFFFFFFYSKTKPKHKNDG